MTTSTARPTTRGRFHSAEPLTLPGVDPQLQSDVMEAALVRAARAGVFAEQIAAYAGVSRQTFSNIKLAKSMPTRPVARRVAEALGVPVGELWPRWADR